MGEYPAWFLKEPFRPQPQGNGEANIDVLFHGVGRIAHYWEHLEGALYNFYTHLLMRAHPGGVNLGAYAATYGAIISTTGRRDVIEAMVKVSFHPESTAFKAIMPKMRLVTRAVGRRNDAVHGLVVRYNGVGLFIMPPNYVPLPQWDGKRSAFKYRYDSVCLNEIASVLMVLRADIHTVIDELEQGVIGP